MEFFSGITFDQVAYSAVITSLTREAAIALLPDRIAGPGGWLVNTRDD